MELDLYIDIIFFVNFFMDFLLLVVLREILKRAVSWKRLGAAAALGGLAGCIQAVCRGGGWMSAPLGFLAAVAMTAAAFGWQDLRELVKGTVTLYTLAILAGGAMELFYRYTEGGFYLLQVLAGKRAYLLPLSAWVFLAAGTVFLIRGLWQFCNEVQRERKNLYPLTLRDGDVSVTVTGYLDTGNCLKVPGSGEGVHIVTERIFRLFQDSRGERAMIPYRTIGNPWGVMEGIRIERMESAGGEKEIRVQGPWIARAPFGLSKRGTYEVLLHGETAVREDKKGGVTNGY